MVFMAQKVFPNDSSYNNQKGALKHKCGNGRIIAPITFSLNVCICPTCFQQESTVYFHPVQKN